MKQHTRGMKTFRFPVLIMTFNFLVVSTVKCYKINVNYNKVN
jgi:hypothetical protein